jgi:hypothetical protein
VHISARRARAGSGGSASYKIDTKINIKKKTEDNKFIPAIGKFWDLSTQAGWRQYFVATRDHARGGTTTRARLTLLDAWPDANETSHGRSLLLGEVLAVRTTVTQPFLKPFLSRF